MELYGKQLTEALASYVGERKAEVFIHEHDDWLEYLILSAKHRILPIAFEQARADMLQCGVSEEELSVFKQRIYLSIAVQTCCDAAARRLYALLEEAGIKALTLKGAVCRELYRQPDYRHSADIDLYVEPEQLDKTVLLFERFGLRCESEGRVMSFTGDSGLHIELHTALFSSELDSYNELFGDAFKKAVRVNAGGCELLTLEPHMHLLYLILHTLKHFLYSGVGIRQICDIAMFARNYCDSVRWHELLIELSRVRADVFAVNLLSAGVEFLGFKWDDYALDSEIIDKYASEIDCTALYEDCMEAGVYGSSSRQRSHSAVITLSAYSGDTSRFSGIVRSLFPGLSQMKSKFVWLKKFPFLLPIAWLIRLFKFLFTHSEGTAGEAVELGERRKALLEKYAVIEPRVEKQKIF